MYKPQPLINHEDDVEQASNRNAQRGNVYALQMFLLSTFLLLFIAGSALHPKSFALKTKELPRDDTIYDCNITLVESIPIGLNYTPNSPKFISTIEAWQKLLDVGRTSLDIGSFYWTMRSEDLGLNESSAKPGEEIFQRLLNNGNGVGSKIKIRIAQSAPSNVSPDVDTQILSTYGAAEVVTLDFPKYFGSGILHTKLWIVDGQHFYLGSANMDWRALTQIKEMGVLGQNCPQLAGDLAKIFKAYWYLGSNPDARIPNSWPYGYNTNYNAEQPMLLNVNGRYIMKGYASSSPPPLSAAGRTNDLDAILKTINTALKFVHISVMDYYPLIMFESKIKYWSAIDNALRTAAVERGVAVKMLISWWKHSDKRMDNYLRSLQDLTMANHVDIQIRRFIVPMDEQQQRIPYARVNHNKYMVTDQVAYIGTSNWSGDYFETTAGIGLVLKDPLPQMANSIRKDLESVFDRDWNSTYAHILI
ncbi:PREDICTED: phospholipase D3-like [Drosophila arizonae]|uniref:Phospholipase D3-like n=1 Tax=Drosophila arizonae TaxID=7263 RepID=A0ABM1NYR6_DROAR|nr:PREDICTED: phospholipase D3-like [Drosophila arizonae]